MLKKFIVKNYKNFKEEMSIDFSNTAGYQFSTDCIYDGLISKMLIYGRNATGKTNLGNALMNIYSTLFYVPKSVENGVFLNADSDEDAAEFTYEFIFDGKELVYQYSRYSNLNLKKEKLSINNKTVFECDFLSKSFDFKNLNLINARTANTQIYKQSLEEGEETDVVESQLPFLKWLMGNVAQKSDSILRKLFNYVRRMIVVTPRNGMFNRARFIHDDFFESLENKDKLKDLEDFFNIMGIECSLKLETLPDGQKKLYFSHNRLVPFFDAASSGTRTLFNLYCTLIPNNTKPSFIYMDEFDAFYHYEMAENVIRFFKEKYPDCQIVMTTHNTNLMMNRLMRPDCIFILSGSGNLTSLCNATERELREGHNLEKMYISGEFEEYE